MADQRTRACGLYRAATGRVCGAIPARLYLAGPRCRSCTPAALAGRPEPGEGSSCPPAVCWCGQCPKVSQVTEGSTTMTSTDTFTDTETVEPDTAFFAAEDRLAELWTRLAEAATFAARAEVLTEIAACTSIQAEVFAPAFGPAPIPREDGRDMGESLGFAADLAGALAAVETSRAFPYRPRVSSTPLLERAAGPVLDALVTERGIGAYYDLLFEFYTAVEPLVGAQAAETVAAVAGALPEHGVLEVAAS